MVGVEKSVNPRGKRRAAYRTAFPDRPEADRVSRYC